MRTSEERSERILKKYRAERPKYVRRRIAAISLLCCVVIVGLVLFVPYGETPMPLLLHTKSEYYDVINSIHLYRHQSRTANNNFEAWFLGLGDSGGQTGAGNGGEGGDGNDYGSLDTLGSRYEETTDNQVNGVIEGDLIKRSDRYVYFFSGDTLYVYDIAGEDTKCVGTYSVGAEIRLENDWCQFDWGSAEIFLSSDVCTVTLVINVYEGDCCSGHTKTYLISLDVRDPAAITKLTCVAIDGRKETVRMIDDALLLVSRYELGDVTFRDPGTFVPTYEKNGKVSLVAPENIVMPELLSVPRYTTVALLDESTLDLRSFAAAYSSFGSVYVSENAVYVTQCDAAQTKHEDKTMDSRYFTEIAVMDYDAEHLTARGSFCVDGFIGSKYAMNEKNGILRVVTTVQ
ncbi:MAG: beta-propeller domain-containing protein, partial [Clostridia bacterium]|nr:beta-propeller domain-containing protein [Clostridia bacterium]